MERRFEFERSRKNRFRLLRIIWIMKIVLIASIGMTFTFFLLSDRSNPEGMVLLFLMLFSIPTTITLITYFTGFTDEHKIITLTDTEIRSELSSSNGVFNSPMNFEIKLTNIQKIKVQSNGFVIYPNKRSRKMAWVLSQSTDQYLELIKVPKVVNDYEELLFILQNEKRKTCANNGEHS